MLIYVDQLKIRCVEISSSCNVLFLVRVETMQWMHCSIDPSWCLEEPISACPAMRVLHVAVPFLCLSSGAATCLDDAIPPSERKNLTNVEGLAWLCWGPTQSHDTTSWDSPRETPSCQNCLTPSNQSSNWSIFKGALKPVSRPDRWGSLDFMSVFPLRFSYRQLAGSAPTRTLCRKECQIQCINGRKKGHNDFRIYVR